MVNAKILYDFMVKFELTTEDIIVQSDGEIGLWFEKPSGENFPLEYNIFEDGSYYIEIFNTEPGKVGDYIRLETGVLGEDTNEANI